MNVGATSLRDARLILPAVIFIATTVYLIAAFAIRPQFDEGPVGPSFVPILTALAVYAALAFVVRDILATPPPARTEPLSLTAPAKVVAATVLYVLVFKIVGYLIATPVYVYVLFYCFGFDQCGRIRKVVYAVGITAVFYVLFEVIFRVRLPPVMGVS